MTAAGPGPVTRLWENLGSPSERVAMLGASPGLPVRPSTDRRFWEQADPVARLRVSTQAEPELGTPWPVPTTSQYARFFRDGNRTAYEDTVRERQRRLTRAALMAAWTDEQRWLDEAVDGLVLLCEQSSWAWAAHDDTFSRHGSVTPTVTSPYLDLGAGELAAQLAWADALLGERLDARAPGVRTRVRHEAELRVVTPFLTRRDWHWLGLDGDVHNWNPWIHGNVLATTLALVGDPGRAAQVVDLVVDGLDRFLAALPEDGAVDEGFSYWWNGAGRALEALDLLTHASGGRLDASGVPKVRETVRFPHRMQIGGPWYVNLADGPARPSAEQPWHLVHRWGRLVADTDVVAHAAAHRRPERPSVGEDAWLGRTLLGLGDDAWTAAVTTDPPLVTDTWLPSVQLLVAREQRGTTHGLTLAAKGGHNDEHHNHLDVGSVVVALDGVPVLVDAGQPTYTAQTFGPDRYGIWTMQSAWHNVPVIAGAEQLPGRDRAARDVTADLSPAASSLSLDLAGTYAVPGLRSWRRRSTLDRTARQVRIVDSWELAGSAGSSTAPSAVHLLLHGTLVDLAPGRAVVRPAEGTRNLLLTWDTDQQETRSRTTTRTLDDPLLSQVWGTHLTRLEIVLDPPSAQPPHDRPRTAGHGRLTVTLTAQERR